MHNKCGATTDEEHGDREGAGEVEKDCAGSDICVERDAWAEIEKTEYEVEGKD